MWNLEFAGFSPTFQNFEDVLLSLASIISGEKSEVIYMFTPLCLERNCLISGSAFSSFSYLSSTAGPKADDPPSDILSEGQ